MFKHIQHPCLIASVPRGSLKVTLQLSWTNAPFDLVTNYLSRFFMASLANLGNVTWGEGASTEGWPRAQWPLAMPSRCYLVDDWYKGAQSTVNDTIPRHAGTRRQSVSQWAPCLCGFGFSSYLSSCPDVLWWWAVTQKCKSNQPSPPLSYLWSVLCYGNRVKLEDYLYRPNGWQEPHPAWKLRCLKVYLTLKHILF